MRRTISRIGFVATMAVCLWLLVVPAANAYIDPGSGSYVLQIAVAGAMAGAMAVKVFWRRLTSFFSGLGARGRRR